MANRIPRELMRFVNKLTNWQRNQWARAGYPTDRASILKFLAMIRSA